MQSLIKIQHELKAPKNQFNSFGKYKYRNQEDILEALKPLLLENKCTLTIHDEIKEIGSIIYVEATARISDGKETIEVKAQAGIDPNRKGMDIAQCFGASSSYARKYALNGLFLIDDTKDVDSTNNNDTKEKPISTPQQSEELAAILKSVKECKNIDDIKMLWDSLDATEQSQTKAIFTKRKQELS